MAYIIGGLIIGGFITYISFSSLHEAQIKVYEVSAKELQRQLVDKDKALKEKKKEIKKIYALLSSMQVAKDSKAGKEELYVIIEEIDKEIEKKKIELSMHSGTFIMDSNIDGQYPKPESVLRIENELKDLLKQRNHARIKLIDSQLN